MSVPSGWGIGVKGDLKDLTGLVTSNPETGLYTLASPDGRFTTYDARNTTRTPFSVTDSDNVWDLTGTRSPAQDALVDAQFYASVTYDFYSTKFGFTISPVLSVGHYGRNYGDAFFNGTYMIYGDGNGKTTWELSGAVDVVGHELTHGVTDRTSKLIYANESGALNEAFSDIMGTAIEWFRCTETAMNGKEYVPDWYVAEDIYFSPNATTSHGVRDMSDPAFFGQPDHYSEYVRTTRDNGGVHTNSGIVNHAFYLLAQPAGTVHSNAGEARDHDHSGPEVTGIGLDAAVQIFFRGFTALPSDANFLDARDATVRAAQDLFPKDAGIAQSVRDAWAAVGVTPGTTAGSGGGTSTGPAGLTAEDDSLAPEAFVLEREGKAAPATLPAEEEAVAGGRVGMEGDLFRLLIAAGLTPAGGLVPAAGGLASASDQVLPVPAVSSGAPGISDLRVARGSGGDEGEIKAAFSGRSTGEMEQVERLPGVGAESPPTSAARGDALAGVSDLIWMGFSVTEPPYLDGTADPDEPGPANGAVLTPLALTTLAFGGCLAARAERRRGVRMEGAGARD